MPIGAKNNNTVKLSDSVVGRRCGESQSIAQARKELRKQAARDAQLDKIIFKLGKNLPLTAAEKKLVGENATKDQVIKKREAHVKNKLEPARKNLAGKVAQANAGDAIDRSQATYSDAVKKGVLAPTDSWSAVTGQFDYLESGDAERTDAAGNPIAPDVAADKTQIAEINNANPDERLGIAARQEQDAIEAGAAAREQADNLTARIRRMEKIQIPRPQRAGRRRLDSLNRAG